jgi:hypothetical protein
MSVMGCNAYGVTVDITHYIIGHLCRNNGCIAVFW